MDPVAEITKCDVPDAKPDGVKCEDQVDFVSVCLGGRRVDYNKDRSLGNGGNTSEGTITHSRGEAMFPEEAGRFSCPGAHSFILRTGGDGETQKKEILILSDRGCSQDNCVRQSVVINVNR